MALIETSFYTDGINFPSVAVYFTGCDKPIKCVGCHNSQLWNFDKEDTDKVEIIITNMEKQLLKIIPYYEICSISFLGGEPLSLQHIQKVEQISKYFKNKYKDKIRTIVFSWRYIEDIQKENKMKYLSKIDYGVLGEYIENTNNGQFLGSQNQYFYNFNENTKIKKEGVI